MADSSRLCAICGKRRPKRFCPGVNGDICPVCCGTEREVTVNCPLDCIYLQEARHHERAAAIDPRAVPNADIHVTEAFLDRNEPLVILLASATVRAALSTEGVVDDDMKTALDSLTRTWRTLQSGLVYEARPDNPLAARVYTQVQEAIDKVRARYAEHGHTLRDADVLGVLVFLQHLELQRNNGRRKGRAFIDFLRGFLPPEQSRPEPAAADDGVSLIQMP